MGNKSVDLLMQLQDEVMANVRPYFEPKPSVVLGLADAMYPVRMWPFVSETCRNALPKLLKLGLKRGGMLTLDDALKNVSPIGRFKIGLPKAKRDVLWQAALKALLAPNRFPADCAYRVSEGHVMTSAPEGLCFSPYVRKAPTTETQTAP